MDNKIKIGIIIFVILGVGLASFYIWNTQNTNLPCGFNGKKCQTTSLGNYYDLEEAKNWDCEKMSIFSGDRKNFCLALKYDDIDYCNMMNENIDDELTGFKKMTCRAIVENNTNICKEITYEKFKQSEYYENQSEKNRKYELEGKLVNITAEEITERDMKSIYNQQIQSCFFQVGADNRNIEACNLIDEINRHDRDICLREAQNQQEKPIEIKK